MLNVLFFDFFFVPPRFTFAVSDAQYVITFGVMLTIGLVIATLMSSVRQQTRVAGARERRTALLYAMSRELAGTRGTAAMARVAIKHVTETFQCRATVLFPNDSGKLEYPREIPMEGSYRGADLAVAQWVADHGRRAGLGSDTLPAAPALYLPLSAGRETLGVLAVSTGQSAARAAARAAPLARDVRRADRTRRGARAARRGGGRRRASPRRPRACAILCSRRSRTTCARRSR